MSTKPCPLCGAAVRADGRFCGQCGSTFVRTTVDDATADPPPVAPVPTPTPSPRLRAGGLPTMIGHAAVVPPAAAEPPAGPPPSAPNLLSTVTDPQMTERARLMRDEALRAAGPASAKTLLFAAVKPPPPSSSGDATIVDGTPPAGIRAAPPPESKRTMMGMPAVTVPASMTPEPPASKHKTMLGVAMPGIAPVHTAQPSAVPVPTAQPSAVPAPASRPQGTLLGVAAPGIAPLGAGEVEHRNPAPPPLAPAPPIVPPPAPLALEPIPERPDRPQKKGVSAVALVALVFGLVAVIGTGAVLALRSGAPLSAQPQLDESGRESLKIRCPSCPDGTTITLGASSSKVQGFATVLPLPVPLQIGDNDLAIAIDRPGSGRDETVKVHVPVAYRVKADLSTLTSSPPAVTVRVEAGKDTEITVDGKTVSLDASGRGAQPIDVTAEVEGPSDEQKAIDRKIPFTIKAKGAPPETGQLVVRTGVAPLHIDAPGSELYTDRSTGNVAGQVKPGGTLSVDGQSVPVDAQGHFGIRVELSPETEKPLAIVANAPPLAPRTVHAKIVRVAALDVAAKKLDARSPLGFEAYGADPKSKVGQLVVVDGEIIDVRVSQGHTVMAVEEKKGCTLGPVACAVRLVHGDEVRAARGDKIRAYGFVAGTASLNGRTIPDVQGSLVMTRPAKTGKK